MLADRNMLQLKPVQRYFELIDYCTTWAMNNHKRQFVVCIIKGLISTILLYISLGALALLANSIQSVFETSISPLSLANDSSFRFLLVTYFIFSILSAWLQKSFYSDSYKLWARQSSWASECFLEEFKQLPNPRFLDLNRLCLDQAEMMRNCSGRPRALGAFGHYSRITFIEVIKVFVFGATLIFLAPMFTGVILLCFVLFLPWIIRAHRRSSDLSQEIEIQQKKAAVERRNFLMYPDDVGHSQTKNFFSLLTENYLQAKSNLFYSSIANTFAVVLVLLFVLLSEDNRKYELSYWVAVIVLGRLFAASVMQLSASVILMSRQAPLAMMINEVLEKFRKVGAEVPEKSQPKIHENNVDYVTSVDDIRTLWLYQGKVKPDIGNLNAMLYMAQGLGLDHEIETLLLDRDKLDEGGDAWLTEIVENESDLSDEFNRLIEQCEFKSLKNLVDGHVLSSNAAIRAAKVQFWLATNILGGKRIFMPSNFLWTLNLTAVERAVKDSDAQFFIYFSNATPEAYLPLEDTRVIQYADDRGLEVKQNFSLSKTSADFLVSELDMIQMEE